MKKEAADRLLAELRESYRSIAVDAASARERRFGPELRRFVDYVRERESVLDVGCGDGRDYELFKEKGVAYAGIDLSEAAVAKARSRWGTAAHFEQGDVLRLPVPDGRYDAVLAAGVLQHIPSKEYRARALRELARAARSGGYVLIAVLDLWRPRFWPTHAHQLFGRRNGWDLGDLKISWKKPLSPRYHHAYTAQELRALCAQAGLDVVEKEKGEGETLIVVAQKR